LRNLASLLVKQMVHSEAWPLARNQILDGFGRFDQPTALKSV